jgi:hypothetical protein
MSSGRDKLEGFLAKVLDRATTDEEAQGAIRELVRRLRLLHSAGEDDLWIALVTKKERKQLASLRQEEEEEEEQDRPKKKKKKKADPIDDAIADGILAGISVFASSFIRDRRGGREDEKD